VEDAGLGEGPEAFRHRGSAAGERIRQIENNTLKKLESLSEAQGLRDCV
jgi:hypothetical protein